MSLNESARQPYSQQQKWMERERRKAGISPPPKLGEGTGVGAREAYVNLEALELELRAAQERIAALQSHGEHSGESAQDRAIAALEELQGTLEELQVAQEEMRQQNEALVEARLQEALARDRYQDLFESAPDAYLVTDLAGAIQEAKI